MKIRTATPADCTAIADIWNNAILGTLHTFTDAEKTVDELVQMIADKAAADMPFLVAERDGEIAGFATYGPFRNGPGYRHTMEHTIYTEAKNQGRGTGLALMQAIEDYARARAVHSLWAGISATNTRAVAFHARNGYVHRARLDQVGYKSGKWLDLILMAKILNGRNV
jgi:L-amino acid N-acyltransferase YncA